MSILKQYVKCTFGSGQAGIQTFEREVRLFFEGVEADIQKQVVAETKRQLARVRHEDRPSGWEQWIDGVKGAPIEHMGLRSVAYFRFSYLREIVEEALTLLRSKSPVSEGDYRMGHIALIDDDEIYDGRMIEPGSRIIITDRMNYARKIEVGKKRNGQPWSAKAPYGVYRPVAEYLKRRWARHAKIEFTFRPFAGTIGKDGEGRSRQWAPCVVITPKWEN